MPCKAMALKLSTQHIIRDKNLFWSYDPAGAKSIGTANCGTLKTLAAGDVKL